MPNYLFTCLECGHTYERHVPLKDFDAIMPCPKCGNDSERVPASVPFVLKGNGWTPKGNA
jgi:putative FmdB family regulatory protein